MKAAMLLIVVTSRTPLYGVIVVVYFAFWAAVITAAPPFVIAMISLACVRGALSRFGPMFPTAAAAFSVWHAEHVVEKDALAFTFAFFSAAGESVDDFAEEPSAAGTASAAMRARAASP